VKERSKFAATFEPEIEPLSARKSSRRAALKSAALLGGLAAGSFLCGTAGWAALAAWPQGAADAGAAGADVDTQTVEVPTDDGKISAVLIRPKNAGSGKLPGVVMVHADRGLNALFQGFARKIAAGGFVTLAPDLLSRAGGSSKFNFAQAGQETARLDPDSTISDVKSGYEFLAKDSGVDAQKISAVGFGWGTWRVFMLAEQVPNLHRAVVFFGTTPADGLDKIRTPFFENYAQLDFRVTGNAVWTEKTMGKNFSYYVYPKTNQQFFYEGTPGYNADAANLAWQKTFAFLQS
jgi:carboxymethylenebutenolidase